jgi:hypothetical protein
MERLDRIEKILEENALAMAALRISQQETNAQIKATEAQIKAMSEELRELSKATDTQIKATSAELRELSKATDAQIKATDAKLKEVGRQLGDIGHSSGDAAEEFFYNALEDHKYLGSVGFDEVSKNIKAKKHRLEDEYDVFLENGNTVGIVEVKHKVKKEHIEKLISQKAKNFRILFPDYSNYKLYVGIAGLAFEQKTEEFASENGIVVLKQKGNLMQVNSDNMRAF